jgi:FkbM family methyltransferase
MTMGHMLTRTATLARNGWTTVVVERRLPWRVEQSPVVQRWMTVRYVQRERRLFGRLIHRGDLVFDIGANVGRKADAFLYHGARVVCVEPDLRNVSVLTARFADDSRVQIITAGVGAVPGKEMFYPSTDPARSTFARESMTALGDGCQFQNGRPIEIVTLDTLIARHGRPRFIKIDVEGFESQVLSGLSAPVPALCFEFHGELWADVLACVSRLEEIGMNRYNVLLYPVGGHRPYHPLDRLYFPTSQTKDRLLARLSALPGPSAGDIYAFGDEVT